jgi:hypothetical protein
MENPFKKRATEFIEDRAALLSLISPQPMRSFFEDNAPNFFDRLVVVVGTPGSGKTTIAKLLEFSSLVTVAQYASSASRELIGVLNECGVLAELKPQYLGYRLPPTSNFREIWELPYAESVRSMLLRSLIQAKTVLGWMRQLERESLRLEEIRIRCREGTEPQQNLLRLNTTATFRDRAREVEEEIYRVITSLVPPSENQLSQHLQNVRFDAFEVLESITVNPSEGAPELTLKPMVMLDDAHELHPKQFADLELWLRSREMRISRWIMTRIDAIGPDDLRKALNAPETYPPVPGSSPGRDRILKLIQRNRRDRAAFRSVAKDISRRYMDQMPLLRRRGVRNLDDCLEAPSQPIPPSQLRQVRASVEALERELQFSHSRADALWNSIPDKYLEDERLAVYRILLNREKKKVPQRDIFGAANSEVSQPEMSRMVKPALVEGADIQLMHQFDRPFYFGFDRLADSSSDNIEQFINLAGALVESVEVKLLRGRDARLDAREQHRILIERAAQTIQLWDFPHCGAVRKVIQFIARKCIDKTLEPNAPLDDGANAYGVPQAEMDRLKDLFPELVPVLHFALAYNAILLNENYDCKGKNWCLFELGGLPILANRLTLHRGGFCEGHLSDLVRSFAAETITS